MIKRKINRLAKYALAISLLLFYIELVNPGLESLKPWKSDQHTFLSSLELPPPSQQITRARKIHEPEAIKEIILNPSIARSYHAKSDSAINDIAINNSVVSNNADNTDNENQITPAQVVSKSAFSTGMPQETINKLDNRKLIEAEHNNVQTQSIKTPHSSNLTQQNMAVSTVTAPIYLSSQPSSSLAIHPEETSTKHAISQDSISKQPIPKQPISTPEVASPKVNELTCSGLINRTYISSAANEEQFLVSQFNYGSERLSDEMFIYQNDGVVYLPMQFLADILMMPLQTEMYPLSLTGWYLTTDNPVEINQGLMRFTAQNSDCEHSATQVYFDDWDLYLDISVVKQITGLEIKFDHARQMLEITENTLVPLSQLLARQKRYQQFNDQQKANTPTNQRHINTQYANLGDLALHADLGVSQRKQTDTQEPRFDGFIQARTHLLGHSAYAGYSWSDYGESLNAYIEKQMADTWVNYYRLGSIDSHNLALVSSSNTGEGVVINAGDAFTDDIRYLVIDGELEPGWDVELYRNGGLIGVQRITDNGQYRFEQVPYYIGLNQYQLRFFGPNGETRTESFSKLLDPSQMKANSFGMNFGAMQREQDNLKQVYASANWAVTDNFTAGLAIIEQQISKDKWLFNPTVTLNLLTDNSVWQLNLTGNKTGTAANLIAQGSNELIDWQTEWAKYNDFESWDNQDNQLKQLASVNLSGNLEHTNMSWALSGRWQDQNLGSDSLFIAATVAGQLQHLSLSNELSWQNIASSEVWANRLALSGRIDDWYLRSYADLALIPDTELTQLVSNVSTSFTDSSNYQFEVRYQPMASAEVTVKNSLSYFLDASTLRFSVENDSEGDWFAQFKWSSSALLIAADNTWLLDRVSHLNTGSVKIIAFQDDNNNGLFDDNELAMSGLQFSGHTNADSETDDNGQLLITHIQTSRPHKLVLNERSLPDPFLLPLNSTLIIQAHPGNVAEVLFPVLFTAELDGEVFYDDGVAAKGIPITLIDKQEAKYHARVEYDGVFIFEQLVPGEYQIEINKQRQSQSITLAPGEYVTFPTQTLKRESK
ncbi:carboxypeptidase regulatory-like domain-containing protein [Shewanella goraebulensis]|uniref:carboxypeptidase regulatory-like domain-containing protein n=1 Tax=Shewanella goraebulensis TaxID=3050637 RepID=UPI00254BCF28|nr:carboxypeptidase regulatory-like domain-containing protein [Shewanella goraebulensis]